MNVVLVVASALLVVALLLVAWFVATYNSLIRGRNATDNAWAQVDVQLKRPYDLVPNLIETVRGYAAHERATLDSVVAARAAAISAHGPAHQAQAEEMLSGALRGLIAVAEAYPQLRGGRHFADLQAELADTENRIAYARQYYNDAVLTYNNAVLTVPTALVAATTGFWQREFFQPAGVERGPVQVRF